MKDCYEKAEVVAAPGTKAARPKTAPAAAPSAAKEPPKKAAPVKKAAAGGDKVCFSNFHPIYFDSIYIYRRA